MNPDPEDSEVQMNNKKEYADVVIIGGGASGLAAAVELKLKAPAASVVILEKNSEPGRKIRATGSGRCNITNRDAEGYHEIMEFFTRIGLVTRTYDNGLVYPYSESAADVAALLVSRAEDLGVRIITDAEAESAAAGTSSHENVRGGAGFFETSYNARKSGKNQRCVVESRYLILACGGKAGPMFGTTGDGYRLAKSFGHSIVTPVPVLTSVECAEWTAGHIPEGTMLAGTRTRGTVTLHKLGADGDLSGSEVFRETGEIQFTRYGLSGICVFNMTRHMRYNRAAGESMHSFIVETDLFPDGSIEDYLKERRMNAFPGEKVKDVLRTVLKENIASYVIMTAGTYSNDKKLGSTEVRSLTDEDIQAICRSVHHLAFRPVSLRGWKEAQATAGGVSMDEIDSQTCMSEIIPGLYITGELADRDYMCGGFNLSNAWITGMTAARSIAASYEG